MRTSLVGILLVALLGCSDGLSPAADVSGSWNASKVEFSSTLTLVQQGTKVSGTGTTEAFINPPTTTFSIAGSYTRPRLTLTFSNDTAVTAHVTATVQDADHLIAVVTHTAGYTDTLTYTKQ